MHTIKIKIRILETEANLYCIIDSDIVQWMSSKSKTELNS